MRQILRRRLSRRLSRRPKPPRADDAALRAAWAENPLSATADSFVLTRIIGNDLEPRHRRGQSRENLAFILDHEPPLAACEKRWIVNRILDPGEETAILALLRDRGQSFEHIPFVAADHARVPWSTEILPRAEFVTGEAHARLDARKREDLLLALHRAKNAYVMHNNGARNAALDDGRSRAKWVLPWDGNCFVTAEAWAAIRSAVTAAPHRPYFTVPMARITDNAALLAPGFRPPAGEEPQIILRQDTRIRFDPAFVYGRRPKVEMFWRLGIPGPWDTWSDDPWDPPRAPFDPLAGQGGEAGWVARLASGRDDLEQAGKTGFLDRGAERRTAILATLARADALPGPAEPDPGGLTCYATAAIGALSPGDPTADAILAGAETALGREPLSVTAKSDLPPSGDLHDYWHPAPYWWPNPVTPSGRPYLRRDGKRVPGTRMYEPDSTRYDRTRLQHLFDDTTALTLAWKLTGRQDFAARAARNLASWFADPDTAMTPHLKYAQVRPGWNGNVGVGTGIIEFKDIHYLLDAVRLLESGGALPAATKEGLRSWLRSYLAWLTDSRPGRHERAAVNNHGIWYDLQTGAIAGWLGERDALRDALIRAEARIPGQITADGSLPHEMTRADTAHYCLFTLQAFVMTARLGRRTGLSRPDPAAFPWNRVAAAVERTLSYDLRAWPFRQKGAFDPERGAALALHAAQTGLAGPDPAAAPASGPACFNPHDGIPPWWRLTGPVPPR